MRVVFLSPGYPREMTKFARGLAEVGATVYGVGDTPRDSLPDEVKPYLADYLTGWLSTGRTGVRPSSWRQREQNVRLYLLPALGRLTLAKLTPADVELNAAPLSVYPQDPVSGVTRENSRLNQILLLRLDPASLDDATRAQAADGIVAYSAICTHAACAVSEWQADARHLVCPCHSSAYDPAKGAVRVTGPTARALPALPIKRVGDRLVIAGPFSAALGAPAT